MRRLSGRRGRPRNGHPPATKKALESLARIAVRRSIDSDDFFNSLVEAWKQKESKCGNLVIRLRKKTGDYSVFLFTNNQNKVVAQFPVPEQVFRESNQLKRYIDMIPPKAASYENTVMNNPKIKDLEQTMKHINLKAKVLEIPKPQHVYTRFGVHAYVSNVLIADETGVIRLSLWNQQINKVSVDDLIKIDNAKVARFRGNRQVRLGRSGKLTVIEDDNFPTIGELKM